MSFDPRAWNIAAGLCLATGCGARTISVDTDTGTDATDETEETESNTTITIEPTTGPECVNASDCPYGYYCYDGMCEYVPHHDGHLDHTEDYWYGECYVDTDCEPLAICDFDYCEPLLGPSDCAPPDQATALPIPGVALALSFVDVDDDGADELVVATQSELHVFESGSDMPTTSARGLDSPSVDAMVGGAFDMSPGDDVVLLFADELYLHASDGVGSLAMPIVVASGWTDSRGLRVGQFDDQALSDLLIWSGTGAGIAFGSGLGVPLGDQVAIATADARSVDDPVAGFVIAFEESPVMSFHDADGGFIDYVGLRGVWPYAVTSFEILGDGYVLSTSTINSVESWTAFEEWGPATGNSGQIWGMLGSVEAMLGADFGGDARDDVAMLSGGEPRIHFDVHDINGCLATYSLGDPAVDLVAGDHDGDGDDELALLTALGEVVVIDGE